MSLKANPSLRIVCAPWIVPVDADVLRDGAIVVDGSIITDIGTASLMENRYPGIEVTDFQGVLLPALVNAHIHLDLSVQGLVALSSKESTMCDWISSLLTRREEADYSDSQINEAAQQTVRDQYESGVGLLLNIANVPLEPFSAAPVEVISLLEIFGPTKAAETAFARSNNKGSTDLPLTGHAPYSTTPGLLKAIKERSRILNSIFSLHLAENRDEALLLIKGQGCFVAFLQERDAFDGTFPISGIDSSGVVGYLQQIGLLDDKTLCVHCVHMTDGEIEALSHSRAHVCLCPGSNRFLSVGVAPVGKFLKHNILPAIGTDSIASNPELNLWHEMAVLQKEHPDISAALIVAMATLGGARALHRDHEYGSLARGKIARFIHVQSEHYEGLSSGDELLNKLTSSGQPATVEWITF